MRLFIHVAERGGDLDTRLYALSHRRRHAGNVDFVGVFHPTSLRQPRGRTEVYSTRSAVGVVLQTGALPFFSSFHLHSQLALAPLACLDYFPSCECHGPHFGLHVRQQLDPGCRPRSKRGILMRFGCGMDLKYNTA